MKGSLCCFVMFMQIVSWVCVTGGPLVPNDGNGVHQPGMYKRTEYLQVSLGSKGGYKSMGGAAELGEETSYKVMGKVGSSPPSCVSKCFGCTPCQAIQVPTITAPVGVQYANYEPEGWKCKCGSSLFTP